MYSDLLTHGEFTLFILLPTLENMILVRFDESEKINKFMQVMDPVDTRRHRGQIMRTPGLQGS